MRGKFVRVEVIFDSNARQDFVWQEKQTCPAHFKYDENKGSATSVSYSNDATQEIVV